MCIQCLHNRVCPFHLATKHFDTLIMFAGSLLIFKESGMSLQLLSRSGVLLGAFANLRNANVRFVISVRLSETTRLPLNAFD
jgi:hypothetical protein